MIEKLKRTPVDIIGVGVLTIIAIFLSLTLLTERPDRPPQGAIVLFWLFTLSNLALAFGRKRIEEKHPDTYAELSKPTSIYQSALSKSYWKLLGYTFSLKFLKLKDRKTTVSFLTFLALSVACLVILTKI